MGTEVNRRFSFEDQGLVIKFLFVEACGNASKIGEDLGQGSLEQKRSMSGL